MEPEYLDDLKWEMSAPDFIDGPAFFRFDFEIEGQPEDTFLNLSEWGKAWLLNDFLSTVLSNVNLLYRKAEERARLG